MHALPAEEAARCRAALLESPQEFRPEWTGVAGRVVVPLEEVGDLVEDPVGRPIVAAFRAAGDDELVCMTTADIGPDEPDQAVRTATDAAGLEAWWRELAPYDVVLASVGLERAVLLSVDEFALVAGPPSFVEQAVGGPLAQARERFAAYAKEMSGASRHLPELARR